MGRFSARPSSTVRTWILTAFRRHCCASRTPTSNCLTPTREDSPVAKYLEKRGEGLHHVAYRVADCAQALDAVKASGGQVIDHVASTGFARNDGGLRASEDLLRHAD
jgi:4-hydroxyphenylpyruvate dioxygenase-like putative hemolysin